jgi:hypothetical protein
MTRAITYFTNITTPVDAYTAINTASNGAFGVGLMAAVLVITFTALKSRFDTITSLIASSATTSIFGLMIWGLGWISSFWLFVPICILLIGVFMNMIQQT